MWRAHLMVAKPFSLTTTAQRAGWRCDYRNQSTDGGMVIIAEVYCAAPAE
jgi:hypothetical protein